MDILGLAFVGGWASGLNAYLTVLALGLLGRFGGVEQIPVGFQRTDVLIVMGALVLVEFVADKIPYVDSLWDALSTVVRPVAGAVIGALLAGATGDLPTLAFAALGGVTSLLSHLSKAGVRLAANTSPEPVTTIGLSLSEDAAVVAVVALAVAHPILAAIVAGLLLVTGIGVVVALFRRIRRGWQALRRRLTRSPA